MKLLEKLKIELIVDSRNQYKEAILSLLEEDPKAVLLDLGCGDGQFTKELASKVRTKKVHGVDLF